MLRAGQAIEALQRHAATHAVVLGQCSSVLYQVDADCGSLLCELPAIRPENVTLLKYASVVAQLPVDLRCSAADFK